MDDFTKKDKYASLHSAIKGVVSQNNDLYEKSVREKYGIKEESVQSEVTEEVEQTEITEESVELNEAMVSQAKKVEKDVDNLRKSLKKLADEYGPDAAATVMTKHFGTPSEYKSAQTLMSMGSSGRQKRDNNKLMSLLKKYSNIFRDEKGMDYLSK